MDNKKDIMAYEPVLPVDFDGTFRFTNWTDEDFTATWGKKEYRFPAGTTSPILMPDQTTLEIQQIRKKFAKDLAEREYFKSTRYEHERLREGPKDDMGMIQPRGQGMSHAGQYSLDTLTPYIQRCLLPLQVSKAEVKDSPKAPLENILSRNEEGQLNTEVVLPKTSLRKKALDG
jgi:hypothetical protein